MAGVCTTTFVNGLKERYPNDDYYEEEDRKAEEKKRKRTKEPAGKERQITDK